MGLGQVPIDKNDGRKEREEGRAGFAGLIGENPSHPSNPWPIDSASGCTATKTPIINLPKTAILGFGAIRLEPVALDDGRIVARHRITLSLTFDHRIVDGAPAARFLKDVMREIADPLALHRA